MKLLQQIIYNFKKKIKSTIAQSYDVFKKKLKKNFSKFINKIYD
jgi:hypothetical protein